MHRNAQDSATIVIDAFLFREYCAGRLNRKSFRTLGAGSVGCELRLESGRENGWITKTARDFDEPADKYRFDSAGAVHFTVERAEN
jgi:hypothetical protein